MTSRLCIASLILAIVRLSSCQSTTWNVDKLINTVDQNDDKNITRSEIDAFFISSIGSNSAGRCKFIYQMVDALDGSSLRLSAMFDLIQTKDKTVTATEIAKAFMRDANQTDVKTITEEMKKLDKSIDSVISKPSDYNTGVTFWPYTEFDITNWADKSDLDKDGLMSRLEISAAMRGLDENSDWQIQRCEFVNSLSSYKQHTVTSSKMYDVIFNDRDITWADVDSDFLMATISRHDNGNVTKQEFMTFFRMNNQMAAGVPLTDDYLQGKSKASRWQSTEVTLLWITLLLIRYISY